MQSLKLNFSLTCVAVTNNVLLCGFDNGKVEMYNFKWKYFVSDIGGIFCFAKLFFNLYIRHLIQLEIYFFMSTLCIEHSCLETE